MRTVGPVPRWAEVRACREHRRRHAALRRAALRAQLVGQPLDRQLLRWVLPRLLPWSLVLLVGVVAAGGLGEAPVGLILWPLMAAGFPLAITGERVRSLTDFERLRMPAPAALLVARWLEKAPWVTAFGLAWLLGVWIAPGARTPTAGQALGALVAPWFVFVSGGARYLGRIPGWCWSLFDLLGLLLAIAVALASIDASRVLGGFSGLAPKVETLGMALALAGMTVLTAVVSVRSLAGSLREPRVREDVPGARGVSVVAEGHGQRASGVVRSWPAQHRPVRSRVLGDVAISVATLRESLRRIGNLPGRVVMVALAAMIPLWNIGAAATVVIQTDAGTARLPSGLVIIGLALFRPVGVGTDAQRWMLGCEYREQARAETLTTLLTAWLPRAVAVFAAVLWCVRRDGYVAGEPVAAALLMLAVGLPVVGRTTRHIWRPWRQAPWWLKSALILGLITAPLVMRGLSIPAGLGLGVPLGALGVGWTAWALLGLPEGSLAAAQRRAAE